MPATYVPTAFYKDGVTEHAESWEEHWQYLWDGWSPGNPQPQAPPGSRSATLGDLDSALGPINSELAGRLSDPSLKSLIGSEVTGPATPARFAMDTAIFDAVNPVAVDIATRLSDEAIGNAIRYQIITEGTDARNSIVAMVPPRVLTCFVAGDARTTKTDDRATIQTFLDDIPDDGQAYSVYFQPTVGDGLCYVSNGPISAGLPVGIVVPRSNISLYFPDNGGLYSDSVTEMRLLVISGLVLNGTSADPMDTAEWWTSDPVIPFTSPVKRGDTVIPVGSGHGIIVGDYVGLRTGNLASGANAYREPDGELHKVIATDATTVTLADPTEKPYNQEYWVDGTERGVTTPTATAWPAPYGLVKTTGKIIENVHYDGALLAVADGGPSLSEGCIVHHAWGVTFGPRTNVAFGKYGISARYARDVRSLGRIKMHALGSTELDPVFLAPSTTCGDWDFDILTTGVAPGKWHMHEGVYRTRVREVRRTPDGPSTGSKNNVSIRSRAYAIECELDIVGYYTGAGNIIHVDDDCEVLFRRLRLRPAVSTTVPGGSVLRIGALAEIDKSGFDVPATATVHADTPNYLRERVVIPGASLLPYGASLATVSAGNGASFPGISYDGTTSELAHVISSVPTHWKRYEIDIVTSSDSSTLPEPNNVATWQVYVYGGMVAPALGGAKRYVTYTAINAPVTTGHAVETYTTTGPIKLAVQRLGADPADTFNADARLVAIILRRVA